VKLEITIQTYLILGLAEVYTFYKSVDEHRWTPFIVTTFVFAMMLGIVWLINKKSK